MIIARIILILAGLLFTVLGACYLVHPDRMAAKTDIRIETALARTEVRATYGGMEIAVGILLILMALSTAWVQPGLVLATVLFVGFAAGRAIGLLAEGVSQPFTVRLLVIEIVCVLATGATALALTLRGS